MRLFVKNWLVQAAVLLGLVMVSFVSTHIVFADTEVDPPAPPVSTSPIIDPPAPDPPAPDPPVPVDSCGDPVGGGGIVLFDPICKSIEEIFLSILDIIIVFAIPIILFFIVWAGFLYVTAAGDATKVQKATTALTYAVIGALLVLGARIILAVITNTINSFTP